MSVAAKPRPSPAALLYLARVRHPARPLMTGARA